MSMTRRIAWIVPGLMLAAGGLAALVGAAPQAGGTKATAEAGSKGHGKMVFVLTTGLERFTLAWHII